MKSIKRITVLVNPVAGSNAGAKVWADISQRFGSLFSGYELDIIETQSRMHTVELGATLPSDMIISISGDGTVHDIAQGLMRRPRAERSALTVIPIGSGNDYSKTLGISAQPQEALEQLSRGARVAVDVGQCNDKFFLETLSFGVDAAIANRTVELRKTTKARGTILYAHAAVLAILSDLKANHVRMSIDGEPFEDDLLICAIQNGVTYGGGFKVTPRAVITDGKFNICMATRTNPIKALYSLLRMSSGKHESIDIFSTRVARQLTLDFDEHVPTQCDGEDQPGTHFDVSILPSALDVIVPQSSPVLASLEAR